MAIPELVTGLAPSSPIPLYHQIADQLQKAIETGRLRKGEFLPSEIDLAERWSVSRPTARRAIQQLVDLGMLVRKRGVGTQVVASHVRRGMTLSSLFDDLAGTGRHPSTKVIVLRTIGADEEVARELGIPEGSPTVELERVRFADERPLAVMRNWLPADVGESLTAEALERDGLYSLLRAGGIRPMEARQVISARGADAEEATTLELSIGSPVLTVRRILKDFSGRTVEFAAHAYDASQYSVEMTLVGTD